VVAKSRCLLERFGIAIDDRALDRELERILSTSQDRESLDAMMAALRYDPVLIKECLVRPELVQRRLRTEVAWDPEIQRSARRDARRLAAAEDALDLEQLAGTRAVRSRPRVAAQGVGPEDTAESAEVFDRGTTLESVRQRFATDRLAVQQEEDERSITVFALADSRRAEVELVTVSVPKVSAEAWWEEASWRFSGGLPPRLSAVWGAHERGSGFPGTGAAAQPDGTPEPSGGSWSVPRHAPEARRGHTAVWTGSEMIVWGGSGPIGAGWRYDPALDSWAPISAENEPEPRANHTAVWTGDEMIIWGGSVTAYRSVAHYSNAPYYRTGGRYDPVLDRWRPTSTYGAPAGVVGHTAVWTGDEMIIWGGSTGEQFPWKGKRYDPITDTWTSMSYLGNAPLPRADHSAVWTGSEMIVWGGFGDAGYLGDGAAYDPATDRWRSIEHYGAPQKRMLHAAVWTGSEMVVVGGKLERSWHIQGDGGRYDPATDRWTTLRAGPLTGRHVVWTGSELITWGPPSWTSPDAIGSRYDPATDSWSTLPTAGAPSARVDATLVWTGREVIVWGGSASPVLDTGAIYRPDTDSWRPTSTGGGPGNRSEHTAVWTGQEMVVWGGTAGMMVSDGWRYELATDTWTPLSSRYECTPRRDHTAVWTGREMVVWGGVDADDVSGSGCAWDATADRWRPLARAGAPSPRRWHSAVWTGSEMVVWGGNLHWRSGDELYTSTGARYRPETDSWHDMAAAPEVQARGGHLAFWTGDAMLVWGGYSGDFQHAGGLIWDAKHDSWRSITARDAPEPHIPSTLGVWTGREMLLWGGRLWPGDSLEGARYDPVSDRWRRLTVVGAPNGPRVRHTLLWAGGEMLVWGGVPYYSPLPANGGRFSPDTGRWLPITDRGAPLWMVEPTAVWTRSAMILFGGDSASQLAVYRPPGPPVRRVPVGGRLGPR